MKNKKLVSEKNKIYLYDSICNYIESLGDDNRV